MNAHFITKIITIYKALTEGPRYVVELCEFIDPGKNPQVPRGPHPTG
jgi:hypothetical protein